MDSVSSGRRVGVTGTASPIGCCGIFGEWASGQDLETPIQNGAARRASAPGLTPGSHKLRRGSTRSQNSVRVQNELLRRTFVKVSVTLRRILQRQHCNIHGLRSGNPVVQDGHHQLPVIAQHRILPGTESVGFGSDKADPKAQHAPFRSGMISARIVSNVQPRNADRSACPGQLH